jgi:hypothetical protein
MALQLLPFWAERPAVYFAQVEAQFVLVGISDERTKFHHIIYQLDHRYVAEVEDIITPPSQQDPYTKLRTELLNRLSPPPPQRAARSPAPHEPRPRRTGLPPALHLDQPATPERSNDPRRPA